MTTEPTTHMSSSQDAGSSILPTRTTRSLTTVYRDPRADHSGRTPAGALITPFVRPIGCNLEFFAGVPEAYRTTCMPENFLQGYWRGAGYYSPGVCPQDWHVCSERWHESQGPPLESGETAKICAPSGYGCMAKEISYAIRVITFPSSMSQAPSTEIHLVIQVRYKETDSCVLAPPGTAALDPQYGCLGVREHVVYTVPPRELEAAGPAATSESSASRGPPLGAIAGIVVGVLAGLVVIALLVWYQIRSVRRSRRAKARGEEAESEDIAEMGEGGKDACVEMDARSVASSRRSSSGRARVQTQNGPAELPGCGTGNESMTDISSGRALHVLDGQTESTRTHVTTAETPASTFATTLISSAATLEHTTSSNVHTASSAPSPESIPLPISPLLPHDDPEPSELSARTPALAAATMAASEKFLVGQNPLLMGSPKSGETRDSRTAQSHIDDRGPVGNSPRVGDELDALRLRRDQLMASKMRLLQLQEIEEEQADVQRQIEILEAERDGSSERPG